MLSTQKLLRPFFFEIIAVLSGCEIYGCRREKVWNFFHCYNYVHYFVRVSCGVLVFKPRWVNLKSVSFRKYDFFSIKIFEDYISIDMFIF